MARAAVTYTDLLANSSIVESAGTALNATDDHVINAAKPELTIIAISNTDDDTNLTAVIKAGDYPPAAAAGQGDLTVTVAFGTKVFFGPFESGRFLQADGTMEIDVNQTTGKIWAYRIPRGT